MSKEKNDILTHRYLARIVLEAKTPLFAGSGESSLLSDAIVQRDAYGFPMIPGTSLAGVLRHAIEDSLNDKEKGKWRSFFGYQDKKDGLGSRVRISSAYLILKKDKIADLENHKELREEFPFFENLPTRQHVRIDHRGTAEDGGLFDNEVVYKGCRFVFEIELKGSAEDRELWEALLKKLNSPAFRIGQGTRKGYGNLSVLQCKSQIFDLRDQQDFEDYLNYQPSFNAENEILEKIDITEDENKDYIHYRLTLIPDDFFIFSKGAGEGEVDNAPVTENIVEYDENGTLKLSERPYTLIPASSIKGAIAHRTAYHYNRLRERFVDKLEPRLGMEILTKLYTGSGNQAVNELFGLGAGTSWEDEVNPKELGLGKDEYEDIGDARRGRVIIDDILLPVPDIDNTKIFNHVAIDRFTGGALDGALFSEKVSHENELVINIYLEKREENDKYKTPNPQIYQALEEALCDITHGLLPLGGMTSKGHGMFTGKLEKFEAAKEEKKTVCDEEKN